MRILLTGALGHIGSRFIHNIVPGTYKEVVLLDNLYTQRYCSLFNLKNDINFRFVEGDILKGNLEEYFEGIEVVIHLAAITNAAGSFEIQNEVEQVNFYGTKRVAEACVNAGSKLIFISTTSIYGTQKEVVDESCSVEDLKPQSPYATSKLRAEEMIQELSQTKGLQYFIGRFGTIYGTSIGMRFHTAVNKFCWQAAIGRPITVWRSAMNQQRPYLDLGDAVSSLEFILKANHFTNQVYNILTENATVKEIVEMIRFHIPDLQIMYVDNPIMNQLSYSVLCDKFKALGFSFKGSLGRGIQETFMLFRNVRKSSNPIF